MAVEGDGWVSDAFPGACATGASPYEFVCGDRVHGDALRHVLGHSVDAVGHGGGGWKDGIAAGLGGKGGVDAVEIGMVLWVSLVVVVSECCIEGGAKAVGFRLSWIFPLENVG